MSQAQGIYLISVVAETLDMHPQTLRKYERAGFLEPLRMGALRAYSDEDVARLRLIKHFVEGLGLNLAGVEVALAFTGELLAMRERLSQAARPSPGADESLRQVDRMLASLGLRLVKRRGRGAASSGPGGAWPTAGSGESIEFGAPR